jgi:hypothetical protein
MYCFRLCTARQFLPGVIGTRSPAGTDVLCIPSHRAFPQALHGRQTPCNRRLGKQSLIKWRVVGDDPTSGEVSPDGIVNLIVRRCGSKALNREAVDLGCTRMDFTGRSNSRVHKNPPGRIKDRDLQDLVRIREARGLGIHNDPVTADQELSGPRCGRVPVSRVWMRIQRDKFVRPFARLSHRNPFQTPCPALRLCLISNRTDQTPGGMGSGLTACALGKAARERATCKTTTPPTIGTRMPRQDIPTP